MGTSTTNLPPSLHEDLPCNCTSLRSTTTSTMSSTNALCCTLCTTMSSTNALCRSTMSTTMPTTLSTTNALCRSTMSTSVPTTMSTSLPTTTSTTTSLHMWTSTMLLWKIRRKDWIEDDGSIVFI